MALLAGSPMRAEAGLARARQREYRLFRAGFDAAAKTARETRQAELSELHEKTARLRALREGKRTARGQG
jgi:hypothetical protein